MLRAADAAPRGQARSPFTAGYRHQIPKARKRDKPHPVRHMKVCIGVSGLKAIVNQESFARATSSACLSCLARPTYHATWNSTTPKHARHRIEHVGLSFILLCSFADGVVPLSVARSLPRLLCVIVVEAVPTPFPAMQSFLLDSLEYHIMRLTQVLPHGCAVRDPMKPSVIYK